MLATNKSEKQRQQKKLNAKKTTISIKLRAKTTAKHKKTIKPTIIKQSKNVGAIKYQHKRHQIATKKLYLQMIKFF